MDTKWKNSKVKSAGIAFFFVLAITAAFFACSPFFESRADSEFENPLTGNDFIRILYESNYVQYRYLREKADQKTWSYSDLYVTAEYLGDYDSSGYSFAKDYRVSVPDDALPGSQSLKDQVREYTENSLSELSDIRGYASALTQTMDYYACDTRSNTSITNSSQPALKEIADGTTPEENPYVYYVRISYDGAGNVAGCSVSADGKAGDFLKRVEALGREHSFTEYYDEDGSSFVCFYNMDTEHLYRYRFTVSRPKNMDIVYALTGEQYQALLMGEDFGDFYSGFLPNYRMGREGSYFQAGIPKILFGFFLLSIVLGSGCTWIFLRIGRKDYCFPDFRICRFPLEADLIALFLGGALTETLVCLLCSWQKGWFLQDFTKQVLKPIHLSWIGILLVAAVFFLYFGMGFILGSILPQALHVKTFFKERSLFYRYWDRILNYGKNFYQELVNFDIGEDAKRIIRKLVILNFILLWIISLFWIWGIVPLLIYSLILYFLLKKYVKDVQNKYHKLLQATSAIAKGNLDIALSEDFGVFESYKNELRQIQTDFKKAVDEEVKSQRMKSELITNVSHDLKTPLTAIITYINLLKDPAITDKQREEYINTLDKKAVRLKVLIEDLFEISKATTNNITLNYEKVDLCNLIRQCYLEYEDRIAAADLDFKFALPEEKVFLTLDPQKTFRIFENLYTNVIKYALSSTRVYVTLLESGESVSVEIKNISRAELHVAPEDLTERFVRGDDSRNTEGSGLGLAIASSFTQLQHGRLSVSVDGDLFKVTLTFLKFHPSPDPKPKEQKEQEEKNETKSPVQKPSIDPRRWRTEKNLQKKKW